MKGKRLSLALLGILVFSMDVAAQAPKRLALRDAQAIALNNHPLVMAAELNARAADQVTLQVRSAYFPSLFGSMTGTGAEDNSRVAAGGLNNPIILSRYADGLTVSQLVTDFGRTARLAESSQLHALAQRDNTQTVRAQVLLDVTRPYYSALKAQSILKVAEQTVAARQLVVDQVTALANSKLKSALDVSFAKVNLAEAKLLLAKAQNDLKETYAELSAALGYQQERDFDLVDDPLPPPPPKDEAQLVQEALKNRPELASLQADHDAALKIVRAERDLWLPTISTIASAGIIPARVDALAGRYGAAGININVPIFNGHLFAARRAEADLKAQAAQENLRDMGNRIARDVRIAWLNANTAFERLGLTDQLLDQANQALQLAQARYSLGLGSIVELSQAQLNSTEAQIVDSSAKYEYQIQYAVLKYQTGTLH